ncbi:MAG: cytosine deaminase [Hyphomicrobium sp.]
MTARRAKTRWTLAAGKYGRRSSTCTRTWKGHTIDRAPNIDGTFASALAAAGADRENWSSSDLHRRIGFGLRCAYAHGVSAIRTHLDSHADQAEVSWEVFRQLRADWAGRIDLQAVSLVPLDDIQGSYGDDLAALVARSKGIFGGVTRSSLGDDGLAVKNLDKALDRLFKLAGSFDLEIDLHVDETGDPGSTTLLHIAQATLRHAYQGRVVCGHCCSLSVQPEDEALRTLDLVAKAEIGIVSLPAVNMYLQDRQLKRTPRWRGVTMIHEMQDRGIPVAIAGDNCRDSFHAYGDHDMIDTFRQGVRILHMDHPLRGAPELVGPAPSDIAHFSDHGRIAPGSPARLIVFNATSLNELLCRPQADRVVLDRGRRVAQPLPHYSELAVSR